jgi:hypothetical protein
LWCLYLYFSNKPGLKSKPPLYVSWYVMFDEIELVSWQVSSELFNDNVYVAGIHPLPLLLLIIKQLGNDHTVFSEKKYPMSKKTVRFIF